MKTKISEAIGWSDEQRDSVLLRLLGVSVMDSQEMRLLFGEMTAQEIRTVRAIVNYILRA